MRQVRFEPTFDGWKEAARETLANSVAPHDVLWVEAGEDQGALDFALGGGDAGAGRFTIPKKFLEQAKYVARHLDSQKWALLYRVLWRLTHGERELFENPTDADVIALAHFEKEVRKDAYRMTAFLRFREIATENGAWFVAWYEPEHDTIDLNSGFFVDRFANMRWSILTPRKCMHWDLAELTFTEGVERSAAPKGDEKEKLWITYYSHIFNPARVKPKAMQAQLLKRNWKNLPEAAVIEPLLREAPRRATHMIAVSEARVVRETDYGLAVPPRTEDWPVLREAAMGCTACPLYKTATCTVFGEGPTTARVMLVGEQPGDQEDREGRAFVGPAGQLLNRALAAANINRDELYVTNAVKHFKWEPRGKRRIHKTANSRDIAACRPWLEAEIDLVRPELIVCLGATAAQSVFGSPMKILENRGTFHESQFGRVLITVHPSSLLRLPDPSTFEADFARFVGDLRLTHQP
ncbi:MAG TPA: UdgX family uracil-DNA binding protein [Verrucomicrobiae bacterium]